MSKALASIKGKYTMVRRQIREINDVEDVKTLQSGVSYALNITEPCKLVYGGRTWKLKAGWNLIGWKI